MLHRFLDYDETYAIEDVRVLQDFLLGRRTVGNGKDFDLCKDGVWNVFDLCLLKREVDKIIVPFCTSGSSPIGSSASNLHSLASGGTTWLDGMRFSGNASKSDVTKWIDSLNLDIKEDDNVDQEQLIITANIRTSTAKFAETSSVDALR